MATITPTKQQQDVLDQLQSYFEAKLGTGYHRIKSIFLSAVAGSGKTSTIMMVAHLLATIEKEYGIRIEWTSLSFNKVIRTTTNEKYKEAGLREVALTTNQLGRSILAVAGSVGQCRPPSKLDNFKYRELTKKYCQANRRQIPNIAYGQPGYETESSLISKIAKLVSAARLTYCDPTEENLLAVIAQYPDTKIDPYSPYWPFIGQAVRPIIADGIAMYRATGIHDFDDQLFLPLALDVAAPIYDFIAIDEAQDLNKVRTELIKRSIKPNGALLFVGDRGQAIQGFAFADTESVDNIIRDTQAIEMPLTCCWRCDFNIIELAKVINPKIEARPGAPSGVIEMVGEDYVDLLEAGYWSPNKDKRKDADMVVCRVTADLVKGCLKAIRNGKYAIVRGKDIGGRVVKMLGEVIEQFPEAYNVRNLQEAAHQYFMVKSLSMVDLKNAEEEIDKLSDQIDTLDALVAGYLMTQPENPGIAELKTFIESKFAEDEGTDEHPKEGPRPIVFSTVHKAKGLETDTVYILRPDLMPHPMAMKHGMEWQIEQEYNILYVAVTRAKHILRFVGGIPDSLRDCFESIVHPDVEELDTAEVVAEAVEIISSPVIAPESQQTAETKVETRGRKSLDKADKVVPLQFMVDPDMRVAFSEFVESLKDSGDFREMVPNAGNALSASDVLIAMMLNFEPFMAFFQTSEYYIAYTDRLARAEARREKSTYKKKRDSPVAPIDEQPDPTDDDPNGGGLPATTSEEVVDDSTQEPTITQYLQAYADRREAEEMHTTQEPRKVRRVSYTCLRPSCKKSWLTDYYEDEKGVLYRLVNGQTVYASSDFPECPYCSNKRQYIRVKYPKAQYSGTRKCDSRCWNATPGSDCACSCGGIYHGTGGPTGTNLIGQPLLELRKDV